MDLSRRSAAIGTLIFGILFAYTCYLTYLGVTEGGGLKFDSRFYTISFFNGTSGILFLIGLYLSVKGFFTNGKV